MNNITVVNIKEKEYIIGAQLASALCRETYNFYRTLRKHNITLCSAPPRLVDHLLQKQLVNKGTRSVTLIPKTPQLLALIDQQLLVMKKKPLKPLRPKPKRTQLPHTQFLEIIAAEVLTSFSSLHSSPSFPIVIK